MRGGWNHRDGRKGDVLCSGLKISAELGDEDDVAGEVVPETAAAEVGECEDFGVEVGTLDCDGDWLLDGVRRG